jgi:hypothetical protein
LGDAKRDTGVDQVGDHVDLVDVVPFARFGGGDVVLVLMVGDHEFDWLARDFAAEILNRHTHGGHRAFAGFMRKLSRHIGQDPDPNHPVREAAGLGARGRSGEHRRENGS